MQHPLQITNHNLFLSDTDKEKIHRKAEKLERFCDQIISCHVTVDAPHHHKNKGESYHVHIDISVPGEKLSVSHESDVDFNIAIRDSFDAARRKLQEHTERRSGEARLHSG